MSIGTLRLRSSNWVSVSRT